MEIIPTFSLELRHNDETLGRVSAQGAIDAVNLDVLHAEARFWFGLRGLRRPKRLYARLRPFRFQATHA